MRAIKRWSFVLFVLAAPLGCGDGNHDLRDGGGMDLPAQADGQPCVTDADCMSASLLCTYKIADGCAAKGHCARIHTPTCAHVNYLCGCNGRPVPSSDCFYETGYAGGPTTGALVCPDDGRTGD